MRDLTAKTLGSDDAVPVRSGDLAAAGPAEASARGRQPDGRSKRWDEHRGIRRAAIVKAGLAAIEEHGTEIGVHQIARSARISRTVLYRYFNDKDDLFQSMALFLSQEVIGIITGALENETEPRKMIGVTLDSVTRWVEEHPMLYQFLRQQASGASDMRYVEQSVANNLAQMLTAILTWLGAESRFAGLGAQAIVGMVENAVSWWVVDRTMSREEVTEVLSDFIWDAVTGYLTKVGVTLAPDEPLPTEAKSGP